MRLASSVNCDPPTRAGLHRDGLSRGVIDQREPIVGLKLQAHLPARARVVVDGHRNRNPVALRERDRQIEIDKEILKHLQARSAGAQRAVLRGCDHRHAPRGDGVGHGNHDAGAAVLIGDDLGIDVERLGEIGAHVRGRRRTIFGQDCAAERFELGNIARLERQIPNRASPESAALSPPAVRWSA